ncbi:MAG: hypothetical protein DMD38_07320 [Gemmatimonadetes bacterium]|nr:MAG: hypothetical protein AUI86_07840 [Gemmatimonadetes bacterium 13_1_40CM_3_66_12]OLD89035.1 MAG: hypothetical protein AUG85_02995 [Gemmatimonadetes bacterium 13_1_20CM_4_66_11]PYP96938.1 MAG: hypothetical protein DMD38_07320 [Gemmatimonadota bacterium]
MSSPQPLRDRALDNLQFIRSAMERAGSFTAVPGWGMVVVGCTALASTWLGLRQARSADWLAVWLGEAALAVVVSGAALVQKARAANDPLLSGPGRRFGLSFLPPIVVGALLTVALDRAQLYSLMPGTWLLLYGTAVATAGAFSVRVVPLMGVCFMVLGTVALFTPFRWWPGFMAVGFGGLNIAFGLIIARRYGG